MNTPTLYLDCVILASTAYPSGLSYSLFSTWRGVPREVSTGLLGIFVLPYLAVIPAVWVLRPGLLSLHGTSVPLLAVAVLLAPIGLLIEYAIHAFVPYLVTGKFARRIVVQRLWRGKLSPADHVLLGLVAVGEEVFYRMLWLGALISLGLATPLALTISSLAYGINHLPFGGISVFSKTVTGFIYGSIFLLGGQSVWLPIVTHVLQNLALFRFARGNQSQACL